MLKEEETRSKADQDYFEFQFRELEDAQLKNFDIEKLEDEFKTLTHAGDILVGLEQILGSLNSENRM